MDSLAARHDRENRASGGASRGAGGSQAAGLSPRSARKRAAIVAAARELFLRHGYLGTSMDDIAALAAVSKQTLYKHVGDKRSLFIDLLTADMGEADTQVHDLGLAVPGSEDPPADLGVFARAYLVAVMAPHLVRLRRLVIGEAERFPELAEAWYAHGPEQAYALFADWFTTLHQRGLLHAPDPVVAAQHFNWLVLSVPLNEAMARPGAYDHGRTEDLHAHADAAVHAFLAAYAPPGAPSAHP